MKKFLSVFLLLNFATIPYSYGSGFTFISKLSEQLHFPRSIEHVLTFAFVAIIIIAFGLLYRVQTARLGNLIVPDQHISFRNMTESYGQFIYNQCLQIIGEKHGPDYFSFIGFLFLVILANNLFGLIPGFLPATENINTTLALGLLSFAYYNIQGCKSLGVINYIKHFMGPLWYMAILVFPIEIISNAVRPMSLALRLRGNMFGDHLVLGIFSDLMPYVVPIVFMVLGILVSFIQAYVFTVLSMVYVSLAVSHHDHDEHGH